MPFVLPHHVLVQKTSRDERLVGRHVVECHGRSSIDQELGISIQHDREGVGRAATNELVQVECCAPGYELRNVGCSSGERSRFDIHVADEAVSRHAAGGQRLEELGAIGSGPLLCSADECGDDISR